jgi:threonine dehydratase
MEISFSDVLAAAERLRGAAHRTPVLTSRQFDAEAGCAVFFKAENLQRGGAFKFRGAYNAIAALSESERRRGILAFSSGNHAQAVALSASLFGVPAVIVMPKDAPELKVRATRGYGAEVVFYDRYRESREAIGERLRDERGMNLVPPFDHPDVIAGQGTAALELLTDVPELDALVVPCSGCGLLAGSAIAAQARRPGIRVFGVEPEAMDDVRQSMAVGQRIEIPVRPTIADGLQTTAAGKLTFPIVQQRVEAVVTVSDQELVETLRFVLERMKVVLEPSGAAGASAVRHRKLDLAGARVGVILSGGNVDLAALGAWLRADPPGNGRP